MVGTVWLEERLSVCERLLIVWMQEVGCEVVVGDIIVCLLVLSRLCSTVCGLPVVSWRMGVLDEQDGAVVGVFWPLPSSPASCPLNAHFQL